MVYKRAGESMKTLVLLSLVLVSCATPSRREKQQKDVLDCVKEFDTNPQYMTAVFDVCRNVYGMKRVD